MKIYNLIICILIILFKTGNVLSDNNIFDVNNIEISKENYKKNENLTNLAFKKAYKDLTSRLLLEKDYKKFSTLDLKTIKTLISYYQIKESKKKNIFKVNVFFDKKKMHDFFFTRNILYSDVKNTEILFFPLLIDGGQFYIYSKNFFYDNWNENSESTLIQYILPIENIENIENIKLMREDIYRLEISNFFKEYNNENMSFAIIEIEKNVAKIFLINKISNKKINKTLYIKQDVLNKKDFINKITFEIKKTIKDLVKSQNLIDVRTPSFLNVEIRLNKRKNNLIELKNRIGNIDLIETFYIQQLTKDYALVKIKYLGNITKIISKLNKQKIDLKMTNGQWKLNII